MLHHWFFNSGSVSGIKLNVVYWDKEIAQNGFKIERHIQHCSRVLGQIVTVMLVNERDPSPPLKSFPERQQETVPYAILFRNHCFKKTSTAVIMCS
jgi:hypothetical protein